MSTPVAALVEAGVTSQTLDLTVAGIRRMCRERGPAYTSGTKVRRHVPWVEIALTRSATHESTRTALLRALATERPDTCLRLTVYRTIAGELVGFTVHP